MNKGEKTARQLGRNKQNPACKRMEGYYMRGGQENQGRQKRKPRKLGEAIKRGEGGGIGARQNGRQVNGMRQ